MLATGARCAIHVEQNAVDTCTRCGNFVCIGCHESDDGLTYCRICHEKVSVRGQNSARATTALVLGLLGLLFWCFPFAIPAVILGHMELSAIQSGESPAAGRNLALGAIWLGWIIIAVSVLGAIAAVVLAMAID